MLIKTHYLKYLTNAVSETSKNIDNIADNDWSRVYTIQRHRPEGDSSFSLAVAVSKGNAPKGVFNSKKKRA